MVPIGFIAISPCGIIQRLRPSAPANSFGQRLQLAVSRLHRGLIVIKCVVECGVRLPSKPPSKPLDSAAPASCQPAASPCGFIATAPASCSGSRFLGSVLLLDHLSSLRASLTTRCRCRSDRNAKTGAKTGRRREPTTPTNPRPCGSAPPIWRMVQVYIPKGSWSNPTSVKFFFLSQLRPCS